MGLNRFSCTQKLQLSKSTNHYLLPRRMCQLGTERFVDSKGNNGLKDTVVVEKALPSSTGSLVDNWKERRFWQGSKSLRDKSADYGLNQGSRSREDSRCKTIGRKHCSWVKCTVCTICLRPKDCLSLRGKGCTMIGRKDHCSCQQRIGCRWNC